MVDVVELKGWILDGEVLPREVDVDEQYFVEFGVEKRTVFLCGYCNEGWNFKREDAEKCCSED